MLLNYTYPTSWEMRQVNQEKIPNLTRTRPTFDIFPTTEANEWDIMWEQKDNYRGLQQLRGLNGEPTKVKMVGKRSFKAEPGVYGEYMTIDERMMTTRAQNVPDGAPIDLDDLILERQDYLNWREVDLQEYIHWKILLDGQFMFSGRTGAVYGDQFGIQTAVFSDWSNLASATPLADLMSLKNYSSGKSVSFGTGSTLFLNTQTLSYVLRNRNTNDLGGQLSANGGAGAYKAVKSIVEINSLLASHNLPQLAEYDEGYYAEGTGVYTKWIPNQKMALVGTRTNGEKLGEYRMVRNANNPGMAPGRYEKVIDSLERTVPRTIEVHRGHNGGPVLFYASALISITC